MPNLIVGVVGGTRGAGGEALKWAAEIGRLIGERGDILLTGGKPIDEESVKAKAMCAARDVGNELSPTGTIGIIPDGSGRVVLDESNKRSYGLYLYTGVSSHERDVLTGVIPDVLIVLAGGEGTLAEAAYAISVGRPLVFLGSRNVLRQSFTSLKENVVKIIERLGESQYRSQEMVESLGKILEAPASDNAYPATDSSSPTEAINCLHSFGMERLGARERYPNLSNHSLRNFKGDFEEKLERLESLIQPKAPNQATPADG